MARKKDKPRYTGIRKGMRILGGFHYVSGAIQLAITVLSLAAGFSLLSSSFKNQIPSVLSFMASWNDTLVGILLFLYLVIRVFTEFFVGRNWRRKAMTTKQQTLTLIISGFKILRALYSILNGGFLSTKTSDIITLVLYSVSFSLAFLMHREYLKAKQDPPAES